MDLHLIQPGPIEGMTLDFSEAISIHHPGTEMIINLNLSF